MGVKRGSAVSWFVVIHERQDTETDKKRRDSEFERSALEKDKVAMKGQRG
jgi:hypothetical protein